MKSGWKDITSKKGKYGGNPYTIYEFSAGSLTFHLAQLFPGDPDWFLSCDRLQIRFQWVSSSTDMDEVMAEARRYISKELDTIRSIVDLAF